MNYMTFNNLNNGKHFLDGNFIVDRVSSIFETVLSGSHSTRQISRMVVDEFGSKRGLMWWTDPLDVTVPVITLLHESTKYLNEYKRYYSK